jgi:predicted transport protein
MFSLTKKDKETIWNQYVALFNAKQAHPDYWSEKHFTRVLTSLMACRSFSWHVVGITRKALDQYVNQDFKRQKKDGITRGHIIPRIDTARELLNQEHHVQLNDFFKIWLANDKTVLCAKGENKRVIAQFIAFDNKENLFNCENMLVGHKHEAEEIAFLKNLHLKTSSQADINARGDLMQSRPDKNKEVATPNLTTHKPMNSEHPLYKELKIKILSLDNNITIKELNTYDSYKTSGRKKSFADIRIQKIAIKIQVSKYPKYSDPKSMLIKTNDKWTLGYHLYIKDENHIDDALSLIKQSLDYVRESQ